MPSTFVIKCLQVIEDGQAGLPLGFKDAVWRKAFTFEGGQEAFAYGVVVTIACRAHALNPTKLIQLFTHLAAGILAATI